MDSKFDTVVLDIETDSLDAAKIHCICIQDYVTGEQRDFIQEQGCEEFKKFHNKERKYIMHNGVSSDPIVHDVTVVSANSDTVSGSLHPCLCTTLWFP